MKKPTLAVFLCLALAGCAMFQSRPMMDVEVEVDFGPANRPTERRLVQVPEGATPQVATQKLFPTQRGSVCCDPRETASIAGVATDPAKNRWWTLSVNGSKKDVSPYKTHLKPRDIVRWEYRQNEQ